MSMIGYKSSGSRRWPAGVCQLIGPPVFSLFDRRIAGSTDSRMAVAAKGLKILRLVK
jgi:hypothetical protein